MPKKTKDYQKYAFNGQREGEDVLFIFRRHIIAMRKGFYLLLIPIIITAIPVLIWQTNTSLIIWPIIGFSLGLLMFLYHFILWYYTIYIVTNQRIRQVTQRSFFGKEVVELRLSKIQNISYKIPGLGGEIFHFGTIVIQTFVGNLVIKNVEHPAEIYNKLQDAVDDVIESREPDEEDIK